MQKWPVKSIFSTLIIFIIIFGFFHFFSLNFSFGIDGQNIKSLPYKFYIIKKSNYVAFLSDSRMTKYFPIGSIFIKKIAAREGDVLNTIGNKFYVNGKFIAEAVNYDLNGKPVKHCTFKNYKLKAGEYFVLGTNKFSYDSRYWGLLYERQIIGHAYPLF